MTTKTSFRIRSVFDEDAFKDRNSIRTNFKTLIVICLHFIFILYPENMTETVNSLGSAHNTPRNAPGLTKFIRFYLATNSKNKAQQNAKVRCRVSGDFYIIF